MPPAAALEGLPLWAQVIFYGLFFVGLAGSAVWSRARGKKDPEEEGPATEQQMVAGAIFSTKQMLDLKDALEAATDQLASTERDVCACINDGIDEMRRLRRAIEDQGRKG